jgi:hypothetical protein
MSRTDRLKEEIGWLKLFFGALLAVDAPLMKFDTPWSSGWERQLYSGELILDTLVWLASVALVVILAIRWLSVQSPR